MTSPAVAIHVALDTSLRERDGDPFDRRPARAVTVDSTQPCAPCIRTSVQKRFESLAWRRNSLPSLETMPASAARFHGSTSVFAG